MSAAHPPVKKLVLFKHGVAYLEHAGPASGPFELHFEKEAMNDVLKSFAAWVPSGDARVGSVAFDSPDDPTKALAERGLDFDSGQTMRGLLTFLRGRGVRVSTGDETVEGEVLGLQLRPGKHGQDASQLSLRMESGAVRVVSLSAVREVTPLDEGSAGEIQVLIDKTRAATSRARRAVRVSLDGPAADVRVAYTVPAPMWRVSYRLVAEGDQVQVMAWAIVHNPVDQDLRGVELVLTTGQPVSFVIDLYEPRTVERAVVQEKSRAVAQPRDFAAAKRKRAASPARAPAPGAPPAAPMAPPALRASSGMAGGAMPPPKPTTMAFEASDAMASGGERGEFFEYRLDNPIDLGRGGSAMAPIAVASVPARRERIWRPGDPPAPDIVLHFENTTGVVLEEGPAVIYDEGGYAGEAMVPYKARGAEVRVGFAKDLSLRCAHEVKHRSEFQGVSITGQMLIESYARADVHTLKVESDHADAQRVSFELGRASDQSLQLPEGPEGAELEVEELQSAWRISMMVPGGAAREVPVTVRWIQSSHIAVQNVQIHQLSNWNRLFAGSGEVPAAIQDALRTFEEANRASQEATARDREAQQTRAKQAGLTGQLGVLRDTGEEGQVRLQVVRELREAEQLAKKLDEAAADARGRAASLEAKARDRLRAEGDTPRKL